MKIQHDEKMVVNGRLTQIGCSFRVKTKTGGVRVAVFRCDCGTVKVMDHFNVKSTTQSCGCMTIEALKAGTHNINRTPKHGKTFTKTYHAWSNIIQRCTNENNEHFYNYGARGITVCEQWSKDFRQFLEDVGEAPSREHAIDRIDNSRGYEPGNVRWVTKKQNQRNRRNTVFVTHEGRTAPLTEFCEEFGVNPNNVRNRIVRGWSFERAITTPVRKST